MVGRRRGALARLAAHDRDEAYFSGSSVVTTMRATFSPRSCWQICGTDIGPSTGWPPVMATASLNRIL
ncbi:Uncharacterised protein [Bordetella pertussis]|nr:Uncharacterised protein [Bordetella pertussis]